MGLKELLLQKGWAGTTFSRQETVERLNPLVHRHYKLNHAYDAVVRTTDDRALAAQLESFQKIARADIGKLSESILSAGGVPYNGTDLEPKDYDLGIDPGAAVHQLRDLEEDFERTLAAELDENHQIRTRAILSVLRANSQARLNYLRGAVKQVKRGR